MQMNKEKLLRDKSILIINGTSEIAKDISRKCNEYEADLIIGVRRDDVLYESEVGKVYNILSSYESIDNFANIACPQLDGLVISIGNIELRPLTNVHPTWLNAQIEAHLNIAVYMVSALVRYNKLNPTASIVFISSINGPILASTGSSVYGMLKSAITGFSKEIAKELSSKGIRSNCICAGMVETDFIHSTFNEQQINKMENMNLTHKLVSPDDISNAAVFLLSDLSKSITGTNIIIDGGYSVNI